MALMGKYQDIYWSDDKIFTIFIFFLYLNDIDFNETKGYLKQTLEPTIIFFPLELYIHMQIVHK